MSRQGCSPIVLAWKARLLRRLLYLFAAALVLLLVAELFCRFCLELGDPPLSMADPEIEYLFKPNQACKRFGNVIRYNSYSMRSDDFPRGKASADEFRVMVFGDSVVNGGSRIDQRQLATSLLQAELHASLRRPVVVGNISAGSWGPPNMLAYAQRYGFFDADVVVVVLSSHDYGDVPTYQPVVGVNRSFPDRKPLLALTEAVGRYLPQYLPQAWRSQIEGDPVVLSPTGAQIEWSLWAVRELARLARDGGAAVVAVHHWTRDELIHGPQPGRERLARQWESQKVGFLDLHEHEAAMHYIDNIHLSVAGQRMLADQLSRAMGTSDSIRRGGN